MGRKPAVSQKPVLRFRQRYDLSHLRVLEIKRRHRFDVVVDALREVVDEPLFGGREQEGHRKHRDGDSLAVLEVVIDPMREAGLVQATAEGGLGTKLRLVMMRKQVPRTFDDHLAHPIVHGEIHRFERLVEWTALRRHRLPSTLPDDVLYVCELVKHARLACPAPLPIVRVGEPVLEGRRKVLVGVPRGIEVHHVAACEALAIRIAGYGSG